MLKISLRDARELSGHTAEDVARHCGISEDEYRLIEADPSQSKLSFMLSITNFLGLALGLIFAGNKSDCLNYNRSQSVSEKNAHRLPTQLSKSSKTTY